jgi:subtilisin family serine protease
MAGKVIKFFVLLVLLVCLTPGVVASEQPDSNTPFVAPGTCSADAFGSTSPYFTGDSIANLVPTSAGHLDAHSEGLDYVPGEVIVEFKPATTIYSTKGQETIQSVHARIGSHVKRDFTQVGLPGIQLVQLTPGTSVEGGVNFYENDPNVLSVTPNYIAQLDCVPNDPQFNTLWGLHNTGQMGGTVDADIDAPEAWNITCGSADVVVAVIDTGVDYTHQDLMANIWTNSGEIPGNGIDDDGNGYIDDVHGWDFVNSDNDPNDDYGHGTHCAGTIAAVGNNAKGIAGVSWNAKIMPLKAGSADGRFTLAAQLEAFSYAKRMGADVISCSFGGTNYASVAETAIAGSPAVVVCAAGNDGTNNDVTPHYPANYNCANIIAVAATDRNDNLAWFSNYGPTAVDVAAPGADIYSTVPATMTLFSDGMTTFANWNAQQPWGLSSAHYISAPSSAANSPVGNYPNNANYALTLKNPIDLSSASAPALTFHIRGNAQYGYDGLLIECSHDGAAWDVISAVTGDYSDGWYVGTISLSRYCGDSSVYLRFRFMSDSSTTYSGYYIDDVKICSNTANANTYAYFSGTSMATPHVAGLAALVKAADPDLSTSEIKQTILNSVDTRSSLTGKVATGGRINAYNAVSSIATVSNAAVVSNTIPATMTAGQKYTVAITMRNTGTTAWSEGDRIRLGAVGDGTGDAARFGAMRVTIPTGVSVAPGASHTFAFTMTAPATAGTYTPQYRMLQEGNRWFGETSPKAVQVTAATPTMGAVTTNETPVTTPTVTTNETPVTTPTVTTNETPVTTPTVTTNETPVTTPTVTTNETPVTTPTVTTNETVSVITQNTGTTT